MVYCPFCEGYGIIYKAKIKIQIQLSIFVMNVILYGRI